MYLKWKVFLIKICAEKACDDLKNFLQKKNL